MGGAKGTLVGNAEVITHAKQSWRAGTAAMTRQET